MGLAGPAEHFATDNCVELRAASAPVPLTSAEFLTTALKQAHVGTWQVDMQTGLATWDAVTSEILGLPLSSIAAGNLLPLHPDDKEAVWERLKVRAAEGGTDRTEFRILRPSGEVRWLRATGHRLDVLQAPARYVAGIAVDITEEKVAAASLQEAEERYRLVSQVTADLIFDWDIASDRLSWNEARGLFFGYTVDELSSMRTLRQKVHPEDHDRVVETFRQAFESTDSRYTSDHRVLGSDGTYSDVHASGSLIRNAAGRAIRMIGSIQNVTQRRYADAALRESEAINRGIVEAISDTVVLLDLEGRIHFVNKSGGQTTSVQDVVAAYGQHWTALWPDYAWRSINEALASAAAGKVAQFTQRFDREGRSRWWDIQVSPIHDETGTPIKLVGIARDVTPQRNYEEQLLRAATYDSLTNLPNRACFQDRLNEACARLRSPSARLGLLLLDVDDFKQVNDSLGHDAGDALLKAIASRLEGPASSNCMVARLGGDEFAVLIEDIGGEAGLREHAHAILARMKEPLVHAGRLLDCSVTIGAALFPDHGSAPDELLKNADIALYAAKVASRGGLAIFQPKYRDSLQERSAMVSLARTALREDRIVPFYQPKVALGDRSVTGFEALLRWCHSKDGMQLPGTIDAAFEDLEVATAISERMIDRVIQDMRTWLDQGLVFGHVAVNAAAAEFRSDSFGESILERLLTAGVPTSCFQLEVTEKVFLGKGAEYVDRALKLLHGEGVRIALDDFGTGYASLRHLKQFPVHVMKIDQGFVQGMSADPEYAAIIEAVLNLGKSLNIEVVAEGIETIGQEARLRELGCRHGQGFLYSEAVSFGSVPGLLKSFSRRLERRSKPES